MFVIGLGMVSSLGFGAEHSAALMRCGYDGFVNTIDDVAYEGMKIASAPLDKNISGQNRLAVLLREAFKCLLSKGELATTTPILVCMDRDYYLIEAGHTIPKTVFQYLVDNNWNEKIDTKLSRRFNMGRCSFVYALNKAQEFFDANTHDQILIISVGSSVMPREFEFYEAQKRLLLEDNSNGFIPGEAATAVLLSKEKPDGETTQILGWGFGKEPAPIIGDKPITGDGLTQAAREALKMAQLGAHEIGFYTSSVSGESYFFREFSIVKGRILEQKVAPQPLWHVADHIGEVGAAVGGAILIQAHYAFKKGYAPNQSTKTLCLLSNDDQHRAAFILERTESTE